MRNLLETKNQQCKIVNDNVNLYIEKMAEADGIILGFANLLFDDDF